MQDNAKQFKTSAIEALIFPAFVNTFLKFEMHGNESIKTK